MSNFIHYPKILMYAIAVCFCYNSLDDAILYTTAILEFWFLPLERAFTISLCFFCFDFRIHRSAHSHPITSMMRNCEFPKISKTKNTMSTANLLVTPNFGRSSTVRCTSVTSKASRRRKPCRRRRVANDRKAT